MKISEIRDSALFQRLVQSLFAADRGYEFAIVDDSGGDRGNDGYDASRGILYAIYCPEKLGSDAKYLKKLREDLVKAIVLASAPGYRFSQWVVVTPFPLREPVQTELRAEAAKAGLTAAFMSEPHLEAIYLKFAHLHDSFPELAYPQVHAALRDVNRKLDAMLAERPAEPVLPTTAQSEVAPIVNEAPAQLLEGFTSPILAGIQQRVGLGDDEALAELERYRLEAIEPREQLAALIVEVQHRVDTLEFAKVERLAARGLELASTLGLQSEQAVFASHRALALAHAHVSIDMDLAHALRVGHELGVPMMSEAELSQKREGLRKSWELIRQLFMDATSWANDSKNLEVLYMVMLHRGNATTQLAFPFFYRRDTGDSGVQGWIDQLKHQVEQSYETAIPIAKALNDAGRLASAYSNFANDLRFFGEIDRAKRHAKHALELAQQAGDERQMRKTSMLLDRLSNPESDTD